MSRFLTEDDLEQYAVNLLKKRGYHHTHGSQIAPGEPNAERNSFRDSVLTGRLREAIARLNPDFPATAIDDATRRVSIHDTPDLILNNQRFHEYLVKGVPVEFVDSKTGRIRYESASIIDFEHPDHNDWLVVNQHTVKEDGNERRPDVVVFINGLPVVIIEFKNPADEKATIRGAFNQLQTYKVDIPALLGYNEILIATDGSQAAIGSLTAGWEHFKTWKHEDGTVATVQFETLVEEVFSKQRLLDIVRFFVVFDVNGPQIVKIIAAYHQYYAVNAAIESTIERVRKGGDNRIGVFWHTQGSGKSVSMACYVAKVTQHPELANPTFVIITDRNDLDGQLFETFMRCARYLGQTPEQADERADLRQRLQIAAGHIVFTTIQKFFPKKGERHPELTARRNVIIIADEAHRSQYGFTGRLNEATGEINYGYARHLLDALPNALRIGFTGTPVEKADHNTRYVFGDYIDIYDVLRSNNDGTTVPIYYEARIAKLALRQEEKPQIDEQFQEITEDQEEDERRKQATKWSQIEALVGAEHRLGEVARDLVAHFEQRQHGFNFPGKGMVVCMSRRICVALYNEIVALRPQWHDSDDKRGQIKVVMTGSAADPLEYQQHLRNKSRRREIEKRFKGAGDDLQLVIVRDMWLTGFDVPSLHTMYVDKPMTGHNLMQAIARVNRVFRDKGGGLIVDYIGIAQDLKSALALYVDSGGTGTPVLDERDAIAVLRREYEIVRDMFHGFPYQQHLDGDTHSKMLGLNKAADFIIGLNDGKNRYLQLCTRLTNAFALASTSDYARAIGDEVAFFKGVRATIVKAAPITGRPLEDIEIAMRQLISEAVSAEGVVDVLAQAGVKRPDISVFSDEFLAEIQGTEQKNLAREMLEKLVRNEIKIRAKANGIQARRFSDMLEIAIRRYDNRSIDTVQLIQQLIEFAKEIRDDPKRAEQMGLTESELAFYDALADNESARQVLGDATLRNIARELLARVREDITTDWNLRESSRARLFLNIKKILKKHGYPPDTTERATQQVLEQAELICHIEAA